MGVKSGCKSGKVGVKKAGKKRNENQIKERVTIHAYREGECER